MESVDLKMLDNDTVLSLEQVTSRTYHIFDCVINRPIAVYVNTVFRFPLAFSLFNLLYLVISINFMLFLFVNSFFYFSVFFSSHFAM